MVSGSDRRALGDPVRGTRPANRRQLIVRAATDLFYEKGYAKVAISDVAEAVAIGPSALYRHFRSKQDLLAAVVSEALSAVDGALNAATADNLVSTVAAAALEHRPVGVLVRRESASFRPTTAWRSGRGPNASAHGWPNSCANADPN